MSSATAQSLVIAQLENDSIYLFFSLRGAAPGFHWGIYVPTDKPRGEIWHTTDLSGGWKLKNETTSGVPYPMSLCSCIKVGTANSDTRDLLRSTLGQVPANGEPSPYTQEAFSCSVWVKDALQALHDAGVIRLTQTIAEIEKNSIEIAEKNWSNVEQGVGGAEVLNETGYSTTS